MGDTTDRLLDSARAHRDESVDPRALAALLATGEAVAAALLAIALERMGTRAVVLDAGQIGLRTRGDRLDSDPVDVDAERLRLELEGGVVVVPGFIGREVDGSPTLLGRGGSDLTALYIAERLGAECLLLKNVDGIYTSDPAINPDNACRYQWASWETAARVGGCVVQGKSIRFAASRGFSFRVTSLGGGAGTLVGPGPDRLCAEEVHARG
jgi:homoserine dehydrogenase